MTHNIRQKSLLHISTGENLQQFPQTADSVFSTNISSRGIKKMASVHKNVTCEENTLKRVYAYMAQKNQTNFSKTVNDLLRKGLEFDDFTEVTL